jgi:tetratricopeptide (TPR) repeat protein
MRVLGNCPIIAVALVFVVVVGCGATTEQAEKSLTEGLEAHRKDDFDLAIRSYTEAIRLKPDFAEAYCDRGIAYLKKGDLDRAIADCTEAIRLRHDSATAYQARGAAHKKKGDLDKVIADYTEAIRLKPDFADVYHARGNAYDDKGDHDRAIADYGDAIRLKPRDADAYYDRGIAFRRKGDYDKAIADYTEAIRIKPDHASAYLGRGVALGKKGDLDKAIADYTEAIRIKPNNANAYHDRGLAYEKKGDKAKAAADFAAARRLAKPPRVIATISAPVVYKELMLVLSDEEGVAAIAFTSEIEYGVKYRYRYLPKHGKEESGTGEVFERHGRLADDGADGKQKADAHVKLSLKAGPLHVVWSWAEAGKGYIYYHLELIRVQIANAEDFEKIDLARFRFGATPDKAARERTILISPPGGP